MGTRYPGFKKCMAMMRKRDPLAQEEGFHLLRPHASEHVGELIEEFRRESDLGLRCWLLELIGEARSAAAFDLLAEQLRSPSPALRGWAIRGLKALGTTASRTLLWEARSFTFESAEETEEFRADLAAEP